MYRQFQAHILPMTPMHVSVKYLERKKNLERSVPLLSIHPHLEYRYMLSTSGIP